MLFLLHLLILSSHAQMTQQMRDFIVSEHNRLRRTVTASNMLEVSYDLKLECVAQAWIQNPASGSGMSYSHNGDRSTDYAACGGSGYVGENWYSSAPGPSDPWGGATFAWVDFGWTVSSGVTCSERQCYLRSPSTCTSCTTGHYTQVMWWNSDKVGCGYVNGHGTTCNYSPGGNIQGQSVYTLGTACSACPANRPTCVNGLCSAGTSTGSTDENECSQGTHNCAAGTATCTNTIGSFTCACNSGYTGTGVTCTSSADVDECTQGTHNCANGTATCTNTDGSFICACDDGYTGTGVTCTPTSTDVNECTSGTHSCSQLSSATETPATCVNNVRSYTCACPAGYTLTDGTRCVDTNECALGTSTCVAPRDVCTNVKGSYTCSCRPGYWASGTSCIDINECSQVPYPCTNGACTNTLGSFTCRCNRGYIRVNDTYCADVNECTSGTHNCHINAVCTNTVGSFTCACKRGYSGTGVTCSNVNECYLGTHNCASTYQGGRCYDTLGSFICSCRTGYTFTPPNQCRVSGTFGAAPFILTSYVTNCDRAPNCTDLHRQPCSTVQDTCGECIPGYAGAEASNDKCEDINECISSKGPWSPCEQGCVNTYGSYICTCNNGFTLDPDGVTCNDIDECQTNNGGCPDVCVNTSGSYNCVTGDNGNDGGSA